MKILVIVISLACFSPGLLAAEEPSPSPTPISRRYAPRSGPVRRLNYFERKHESEARAGEAQRQVAAEARIETKKQIPRANSDLMSRMGFSEDEIAAEKAREQPAKSGAKETTGATSQAQRQQEQPATSNGTGVVGEHLTVPPAKTDAVAPQKPTSASSAANPDSH